MYSAARIMTGISFRRSRCLTSLIKTLPFALVEFRQRNGFYSVLVLIRESDSALVSAYEDALKSFRDYEADHFVGKPFEFSELVNILNVYI